MYTMWICINVVNVLHTTLSLQLLNPDLQIEFKRPQFVRKIHYINRKDCCLFRLSNVGFFIGNEPAVKGQLTKNTPCQVLGKVRHREVTITCNNLVRGKYVVLQNTDSKTKDPLQVNNSNINKNNSINKFCYNAHMNNKNIKKTICITTLNNKN